MPVQLVCVCLPCCEMQWFFFLTKKLQSRNFSTDVLTKSAKSDNSNSVFYWVLQTAKFDHTRPSLSMPFCCFLCILVSAENCHVFQPFCSGVPNLFNLVQGLSETRGPCVFIYHTIDNNIYNISL